MNPRKDLTSLTFFGLFHVVTASISDGSVSTTLDDTTYPIYPILSSKNLHFDGLSFRPTSARHWNTASNLSECSFMYELQIKISSRYIAHIQLLRSYNTLSINHWNVPGALHNPKHIGLYSQNQIPGTEKAVLCLSNSSISIWQSFSSPPHIGHVVFDEPYLWLVFHLWVVFCEQSNQCSPNDYPLWQRGLDTLTVIPQIVSCKPDWVQFPLLLSWFLEILHLLLLPDIKYLLLVPTWISLYQPWWW